MLDRNFAGTKASDLCALLHFAEPGIHFGRKVGLRQHDLKFAVEAFGPGLCHLHSRIHVTFSSGRSLRVVLSEAGLRARCPVGVVRAEGLEPPRLSPREPKSRASTNSATPALGIAQARPSATGSGALVQDGFEAYPKNVSPGNPTSGAAYNMPISRRTIKMVPKNRPSGLNSARRAMRFRRPEARC